MIAIGIRQPHARKSPHYCAVRDPTAPINENHPIISPRMVVGKPSVPAELPPAWSLAERFTAGLGVQEEHHSVNFAVLADRKYLRSENIQGRKFRSTSDAVPEIDRETEVSSP